ncbi:hypothetical protein Gotur_011189 [Gossypium turneri]
MVSSTPTRFSCGIYCDSIVHELKPIDDDFNFFLFTGLQKGYHNGGVKVLKCSSYRYYAHELRALDAKKNRLCVVACRMMHRARWRSLMLEITQLKQTWFLLWDLVLKYQPPQQREFQLQGLKYEYSEMDKKIQISAEVFYGAETSEVCMIGCRDLRLENKVSLRHLVDCELLINIHFLHLNSNRKESNINGNIKSLYQETDWLC